MAKITEMSKMLSKQEVIEIMAYCNETGSTFKARLRELDIKPWRFFDAKRKYIDSEDGSGNAGEFVQLVPGGAFVPVPEMTSRSKAKRDARAYAPATSVEMRMTSGAIIRITGALDPVSLQAIIRSANVQS